jgi:hypothetical protein
MMAKRVSELTPAEAEERRRQRREMYAQNPERQRGYSSSYRRRKAEPGKVMRPAHPRSYDALDYAEEWDFLTEAGLLSTEIIDRSMPSKAWFKKHVTPLVKYSNCPGCGRKYLVAKSGTILICGKDCPKCNYTEDFHVSRRVMELSHG